MTIKEVEKLTGLTAKSIRYYEDKGLLMVERNEENDYRSYSENEVNRLKKIKLLRYLEFSVEEVKTMLDMDSKHLAKLLREKANVYEDMRDRCKDKQELCLSLAVDCKKEEEFLNKVLTEYNEFIQHIESEEVKESIEELKYLGAPGFSLTLLQTLILSGPIGWLFINISEGKLEDLMLNAGLALVCMALITADWIFYFVHRHKYKDRVKKKNKNQSYIMPMVILGIPVGILLMVKIASFIEKLLVSENFLFYRYPQWASYGMAWIVIGGLMVAVLLILAMIIEKSGKKHDLVDTWLWLWRRIGKWKILVIGILLIGFYCCATSFTVVTENAIICHSPMHPRGVKYSYSDVEQITAGVGNKKLTLKEHERKGKFFYQIRLDGKTITFLTDCCSNDEIERYNEHTYLWFEEFDQKLVELGVPKISDSKGCEDIDMGEEYVERFRRILENKRE